MFLLFGCLRRYLVFSRISTQTAHRINKVFLLVFPRANSFYAYEIWLLKIYKFLIQHRKKCKAKTEEMSNQTQIDMKSLKYPHSN